MAFESNALTLAEYSNYANNPVVTMVTERFYKDNNLATYVKFKNKKKMRAAGTRFLPGNGAGSAASSANAEYRDVNSDPNVAKYTPTPYEEQLYIMSERLQLDRMLVEDEDQITDPVDAQTKMHLKRVTRTFNDGFINNTPTINDKAPMGLKYRLCQNPTQYNIPSEMWIAPGSAVDLRLANMTAATADVFFEYFDQALDAVGSADGDNVVAMMNDTMFRRFTTAAARGNRKLSVNEDSFDRKVKTYRNCQLVNVGRKVDDSTRIITSTETLAGTADTGSTHTSIYFLNTDEDGFVGWQYRAMAAQNLGLSKETGTKYNVLFEWPHGFMQNDPRAALRLCGLLLS